LSRRHGKFSRFLCTIPRFYPQHVTLMLQIAGHIQIPDEEITFSAIRAQGAGGQNVNKVSSAIHLRFDIPASSLPAEVKEKLLSMRDKRISGDGVLIIKAQRYRSQEKNRAEAIERLSSLVSRACVKRKPRRPTAPGRAARARRMDTKTRRGQVKAMRRKPEE
jgi:ribosome-associated protein